MNYYSYLDALFSHIYKGRYILLFDCLHGEGVRRLVYKLAQVRGNTWANPVIDNGTVKRHFLRPFESLVALTLD